jgi:hypothetical protein
MVRTFAAYLDFCYIVRRSILNEDSLNELDDALERFHRYRTVFQETGVRGPEGLSLPRQHAMKHYHDHILAFGAPNGLCSSITESKHIKAVKEPWRRSSHFNALGQMLLTNQRLDKLAAAHVDFDHRRMLTGSCFSQTINSLQPVSESPEDNDASPYTSTASPINANTDDNEDEDCGPDEGPTVSNHVFLAKTKGIRTAHVYHFCLSV